MIRVRVSEAERRWLDERQWEIKVMRSGRWSWSWHVQWRPVPPVLVEHSAPYIPPPPPLNPIPGRHSGSALTEGGAYRQAIRALRWEARQGLLRTLHVAVVGAERVER